MMRVDESEPSVLRANDLLSPHMSDPRKEIAHAEVMLGYGAPHPAANSYSPHKLFVAQALGLWMLAENIVWGPSRRFWRATDRNWYEPLCRENELHTIAAQDEDFESIFPIATRMLKATPSTAWGECVLACGMVPIVAADATFAHGEEIILCHD